MAKFFKDQLKGQLDGIKAQINTPDILSGLDTAQRQFASLNTSVVGDVAGKVNNGVKALSSVTGDFPVADISSKMKIELKNGTTVPQNLQNAMGNLQSAPAELTDALPGVGSKIKKALPSAEAAISNGLTGSTVAAGFNNICLALPTAAGIAAAMPALSAEITSNDVKGVVEASLGDFNPALKAELPDISDFLSNEINLKVDVDLSSLTKGITDGIGNVVGSITGAPILDTLHKMNNSVSQITAGFNLPINSSAKSIAGDVLTAFANDNASGAFDLIKDAAVGLSVGEIEGKLVDFNISLGSVGSMLSSTSIEAQSDVVSTNPISDISNAAPTVNSLEEFAAELANNSRDIEKLVIGWLGSPENTGMRKADLEKLYEEQAGGGVTPVTWHYYIWGDGTIERGTPLGKPGFSPEVVGEKSIDVVIEGGSEYDLITDAAKKSAKSLIVTIYDAYPGIILESEADYPEYEQDYRAPGFDIETFAANVLKKTNTKQPEVKKEPENKDLGLPTGKGDVKYAFNNKSIRNKNIQPQLMAILEEASAKHRFKIRITSGGQNPNSAYGVPGGRTGTSRHDYGWAADLQVYDANGSRVNFAQDTLPNDVLAFVKTLAALGITGMGAGPDYMAGNLHVDIAWGRNSVESYRYWGKPRKKGGRPANWLAGVMRYYNNT